MKRKISLFLTTLMLMCGIVGCTVSDTSTNISSDISSSSSSFDLGSSITNQSDSSSATIISSKEQNTHNQASGKLKVHFLDVGQADSIFIELPNKQTMLIDAANSKDSYTIIKYIKNLGYDTLNYVIATHPHADHIGGMTEVIDAFNIEKFYMPRKEHTTKTFENMLIALQGKGVGINTARCDVSIIDQDNLNIDIVAPVEASYDNLNDFSAVVKLTYGKNSFLFTGDAEHTAESQITANIKADVLKVGHHGSETSTTPTFLSKVSPKYAVISCGKGNSYGHPHSDTLSKLNSAGISIYRTDEVGTIICETDGKTITVDKKASSIKENAPPTVSSQKETVSSSSTNIDNSGDNQSTIVYITRTGEKYHTGGCQYLRKSKIEISLANAKRSYEPCSKCNPPR